MNDFSNLNAILLGILQGITEFLPISSSAHLILFSKYLNDGKTLPLFYNVALHLGTALAILIYFHKDWLSIFSSLKKGELKDSNTKLLINLVIGSIPAAIIGLSMKDYIESTFHHTSSVIIPLIIVGIVLWLTDFLSKKKSNLAQLSSKEALLIGFGQSIALIPGVSRSASTIIVARVLGLDKVDSARFSFLLGTPVMLGAAALHFNEFYQNLYQPALYSGLFTAFFVGLISIHLFLKIITRFGFLSFAIYRVILGLILAKIHLF